MFEAVLQFLRYTGIKPETFGRLVANDADLVWKLEQGWVPTDELKDDIIAFMQRYEDGKE